MRADGHWLKRRMMKVKLTDVKDGRRGAVHKQWWFDYPESTYLSNKAVAKPYYHYLSAPGAPSKRWMRMYTVELEEGAQVVRYVRRGRKTGWVRYEVVEGVLVRQESQGGAPPWMTGGPGEMPEELDNDGFEGYDDSE